MTTASSLKKRGVRLTQRAVNPRGRLPRRGYEHCFIEEEGVHSRLHLHHFYSMFLPDVTEPVDAHVHVFGADGARLGVVTRTLQPLSSLVLPMTEVLTELKSTETLGSVALDVEPSAGYERKLVEIGPDNARAQSPFWMGYYDAGGSVAYVHSIDQFYGEVFGVPRAAGFAFRARWHRGAEWSSKRLIDAEGLRRADAYLVNYSSSAGATTIRWRAHPGGAVLVAADRDRAAARRGARQRERRGCRQGNRPGATTSSRGRRTPHRERQAVRDAALRGRTLQPPPRLAVRPVNEVVAMRRASVAWRRRRATRCC